MVFVKKQTERGEVYNAVIMQNSPGKYSSGAVLHVLSERIFFQRVFRYADFLISGMSRCFLPAHKALQPKSARCKGGVPPLPAGGK